MEYDFRNRTGSPYDTQSPMYGRPATGAPPQPHTMYGGGQHYPRVGQHPGGIRNPPFHHTSSPAPTTSTGIGIRVAIKPEYRITPPPPLSTQLGDIPRSTFNFDFDLEKRILSEAEKGTLNWSRLGLDNLPPKMPQQTNTGSSGDPVINKYAAHGFNKQAVALAIANYGDNPVKVKEFVEAYARLTEEMGFSPNSVADALLMNDNNTEKALAQLMPP